MRNARWKMEYGVHGPPLNHSIGIEGMTVSGNGIDLCYRRSLLLPVGSERKVKLAIDVLLVEYRRISLIYWSDDGTFDETSGTGLRRIRGSRGVLGEPGVVGVEGDLVMGGLLRGVELIFIPSIPDSSELERG